MITCACNSKNCQEEKMRLEATIKRLKDAMKHDGSVCRAFRRGGKKSCPLCEAMSSAHYSSPCEHEHGGYCTVEGSVGRCSIPKAKCREYLEAKR